MLHNETILHAHQVKLAANCHIFGHTKGASTCCCFGQCTVFLWCSPRITSSPKVSYWEACKFAYTGHNGCMQHPSHLGSPNANRPQHGAQLTQKRMHPLFVHSMHSALGKLYCLPPHLAMYWQRPIAALTRSFKLHHGVPNKFSCT